MASKHRLIIKVEGFVQGVGFRWYVQNKAMELGLKGFVKNCQDGSVLIDAEGQPEVLDRLKLLVKKGPSRSMVTNVYVDQKDEFINYTSFDIR
jgi:acylphosphatase